MAIPDDFERECLYAPSQWYVHDVLKIDRDNHEVVAVLDTTRIGALVEAQQPHAGHPPHVPGAVAIQLTGTLGNLHAVYVLGLRPSAGWVGYGTHVKNARFHRMGRIGPPLVATSVATKRRQFRGAWFLEYRFAFTQDGELVYESEQSAVWRQEGRGES
jgi:hypothetical protein